jgi:hypothetical protein
MIHSILLLAQTQDALSAANDQISTWQRTLEALAVAAVGLYGVFVAFKLANRALDSLDPAKELNANCPTCGWRPGTNGHCPECTD